MNRSSTLGVAALGLGVGPDPAGGGRPRAASRCRPRTGSRRPGSPAPSPAGCRRRSRSTPTTRWGATPRSARVWAMRVGPSRLTSTAPSSGESKLTVAAEWITMSHEARVAASGVVEPEAVGADVARRSPAPGGRPARRTPPLPPRSRAQAVEAVVLEDLPLGPLVDRRACARAGRAGRARSRAPTAAAARPARCPRKPVEPVTAMRFPARASRDHDRQRRPLSTIW